MIHDVDESLRELVTRDVLNGANVEVSFEAPTREWSARRNAPALNLYLYEIREDLDRREFQFEDLRDERGLVVARRPPPRKFKLSYLVTAWTQRPEDEHRLLSATLRCFLVSDALPAEVLQGELAGQPYPIRTTIALPLPPDRSVSDIWTALGGELKPSLDLIVTTPFDTGRSWSYGPPVFEEPRINLTGAGGAAETAGRNGKKTSGKPGGPDDPGKAASGGRASGKGAKVPSERVDEKDIGEALVEGVEALGKLTRASIEARYGIAPDPHAAESAPGAGKGEKESSESSGRDGPNAGQVDETLRPGATQAGRIFRIRTIPGS
jgi:hypothetical protein